MKTEILKVKGTWADVLDDCRASMGKTETGKEPSPQWKQAMVIAEHSPIRDLIVRFRWARIKYWVAMHFKTHIWYSVATSQRNDRQGKYDRNKAPQDEEVALNCEANIQHLIDTARKRLCRQASMETREYMEDLKLSVREHLPEVAFAMVPNCVYRGGCPELNGGCGLFDRMLEEDPEIGSHDIRKRYEAYARWEASCHRKRN